MLGGKVHGWRKTREGNWKIKRSQGREEKESKKKPLKERSSGGCTGRGRREGGKEGPASHVTTSSVSPQPSAVYRKSSVGSSLDAILPLYFYKGKEAAQGLP